MKALNLVMPYIDTSNKCNFLFIPKAVVELLSKSYAFYNINCNILVDFLYESSRFIFLRSGFPIFYGW